MSFLSGKGKIKGSRGLGAKGSRGNAKISYPWILESLNPWTLFVKKRKRVYKPSSVSPKIRRGWSFLSPGHCCQGLATYPGASSGPLSNAPLFGLAPGGVYHASPVTRTAVSSYLAFSPLPRGFPRGGMFSVALSLGSPPVAISDHPALWSSDFPPVWIGRSPDPLPQP